MEPAIYYILHGNQHAGPFTRERVEEMIAKDEITLEHYGCYTGMTDWRKLNEILPPLSAPPVPVVNIPHSPSPSNAPACGSGWR